MIPRTRKEAHAAGLKRFYTGKPCHNGHDCERYVSSGGCLDCVTYKTAPKMVRARNLAWPEHAFLFEGEGDHSEFVAALRFMAYAKWHEAALTELRKDPVLMARFKMSVSKDDLARARALINEHELVQQRDRESRGLK
jgi:hypothetical protein